MSPLVLDFLKSAVGPAFAAALGFLIVGGRSDPWRARLQSLFFTLAFVGGCFVLLGRLDFPPHDVNDGFIWVAVLLGLFVWISPRGLGPRYLVRALVVVLVGYLTLWQIHESLAGRVHQRNLLAFFFLGLGVWSILERGAQQVQTLTLLALPLVSASALSVLLMFKGSAALSQIVSVLCALLGATLVVTWLSPKRVSKAAVMPFVSVFVIAFMAVGHFYLDINPWTMIYLCIPYLFLWIRNWLPFVPKAAAGEAILLAVLSALPLVYLLWNVYQASGPLY